MRWEEYREGVGLQLKARGSDVLAIVECDGRICSGSKDWPIQVWSRESEKHEQTLYDDSGSDEDEDDSDDEARINALAMKCDDRLISGHYSSKLREWRGACPSMSSSATQVQSGRWRRAGRLWLAAPWTAPSSCGRRRTVGVR